ncbi:cysteine hydrolase family protein [Peribacillus loiseleuriae]|uniref:Isochorismatase n=1 Tax=Peribacillus loiseleuriae TaxID=1679170 RepID=A0A0K9GPD4_9BACI|nr:isochorismatase family cysteine hydrolase [Peribacillus loiseleuriae]KMY48132.1 isochorismatase [Peribacillus loiseleuriae]
MNQEKPQQALLIIDMINDFKFQNGDMLLQHTIPIIQPIITLKNICKAKGYPIIYINDHYNLWQANYDKIIALCKNEKNIQIIEQIIPEEDDYFLIKPKHSAFYGTALHILLHHLGVNRLAITGIAGNICVLFTANDAYMREYPLWVPENCLASASNDDNQYALTMMKNVLKAQIEPV